MTGAALLALVLLGGLYAIVERVLEHLERRRDTGIYSRDQMALACRAAAYRAADPEMADELVEALVVTVLEDLNTGVLSDPRPAG